MPEVTEECKLDEKEFAKHGCFYSVRGADGTRKCCVPCAKHIQSLENKVKELTNENEKLKTALHSIRSEV